MEGGSLGGGVDHLPRTPCFGGGGSNSRALEGYATVRAGRRLSSSTTWPTTVFASPESICVLVQV